MINTARTTLQVNPDSADEVEMDSMWSRIGGNHGESILDDKTVSVTLCLMQATAVNGAGYY